MAFQADGLFLHQVINDISFATVVGIVVPLRRVGLFY